MDGINCTSCNAQEFCRNISQLKEVSPKEAADIMSDIRFNCCSDFKIQHRGMSLEMCVPFAAIFLLSVIGNSLVILTLIRHRKMRTITNVYLLNLALSDLLLAVFCMPFTLVPLLMQQFVFGQVMCVLIRYFQAVSVGVSCFTLVAISIERFYAICQPLRSRRWQTLSHSYKVICVIWMTSLVTMIPIAVFNKVLPLANGVMACREIWSNLLAEKLYTGLLDMLLLLLPLVVMAASYGRIVHELGKDITCHVGHPSPEPETTEQARYVAKESTSGTQCSQSPILLQSKESKITRPLLAPNSDFRQGNQKKILQNKKRVVKMLCIVVLEYFLCWTPLYFINTWTVMDYISARRSISLNLKSAIILVAYLSSCIHPITYCFMNRRFRQAFVKVFDCCGFKRNPDHVLSETSNGKYLTKQVEQTMDTTTFKYQWRNRKSP